MFSILLAICQWPYLVLSHSQIHWHNKELVTGQRDSSGMTLYYTSQLRANTGQVLRIGQRYIHLTEGKRQVEIEGKCSGACTELMSNKTTKIASAFIRMNKLGTNISRY